MINGITLNASDVVIGADVSGVDNFLIHIIADLHGPDVAGLLMRGKTVPTKILCIEWGTRDTEILALVISPFVNMLFACIEMLVTEESCHPMAVERERAAF